MCMLLDIVEVAVSHSGVNLATAFAQILDDFKIADKVSKIASWHAYLCLPDALAPVHCV